jgi:hypothetical protein
LILTHAVIPAKAGIQNLGLLGTCEDLRVWIPAFAGMTGMGDDEYDVATG